jgi:hypothetical protein
MPELVECQTDSNGNIIYEKNDIGQECWFGVNGTMIHYKVNNEARGYDSNGNCTYFKDTNGDERWYNNGKIIHFKYTHGLELWYDSNGNEIENPNA